MITIHQIQQSKFDDLVRQSLILNETTGEVYWQKPPPQHSEKLNKLAGNIRVHKRSGERRHYIKIGRKAIPRARIVFFLFYGYWPTPKVDHINRDPLDDRPINLRQATSELNNHNHSRRNIRLLPSGKYQVRLGTLSLGAYDTMREAIKSYDDNRAKLWQT